jgi:hypothetical protein
MAQNSYQSYGIISDRMMIIFIQKLDTLYSQMKKKQAQVSNFWDERHLPTVMAPETTIITEYQPIPKAEILAFSLLTHTQIQFYSFGAIRL